MLLYNLSYFGNSNILTTVYRSVYSFNDYDLQKKKLIINKSIIQLQKNEKKRKRV